MKLQNVYKLLTPMFTQKYTPHCIVVACVLLQFMIIKSANSEPHAFTRPHALIQDVEELSIEKGADIISNMYDKSAVENIRQKDDLLRDYSSKRNDLTQSSEHGSTIIISD